MASTHTYDLSSVNQLRKKGAVEVALNPNELETIDEEGLRAKYDDTIKQQQESLKKEDLSDMVASHVARQKRKQQKEAASNSKQQNKKHKDFKF